MWRDVDDSAGERGLSAHNSTFNELPPPGRELERLRERIATLEAEVERTNDAYEAALRRMHAAEAEVEQLRENEYAVLHKGLDLMAWVTVAEAAQARVRELEEKLNKLMQAPPGTIIVPFPL